MRPGRARPGREPLPTTAGGPHVSPGRPDRLGRAEVVAVVTLALLTTPVVGVAGAGGATTDRAAVDRGVQTTSDGACVSAASGAAYPSHFAVSCPTGEGENLTTTEFDLNDGWGYVAIVSVPPDTNESELPVAPGEVHVSLFEGMDNEVADVLVDAWETEIQVSDSEFAVVVQSSIRGLPASSGGDPATRYFEPRSSRMGLDLPPGTYDVRTVAYGLTPPIPSSSQGGGQYLQVLREEIDRIFATASTVSASLTLDLGQCGDGLDFEDKEIDLFEDEQSARAEANADARTLQDEESENGASTAEASATAARSGSPNGAMGSGLPDAENGGENVRSGAVSARSLGERVQSDLVSVGHVLSGGNLPEDWGGSLPAPDVSAGEAVDAVTDSLQQRGYSAPPGTDLSIEDYIETDVSRGYYGESVSSRRTVRIRLGPDGNMLPQHERLPERESGPCSNDYYEKATQWIEFRFYGLPGGDYDVHGAPPETPFSLELYAVDVAVDDLIHATEVAETYAKDVFFGYDANNAAAALRRKDADGRDGEVHRPD